MIGQRGDRCRAAAAPLLSPVRMLLVLAMMLLVALPKGCRAQTPPGGNATLPPPANGAVTVPSIYSSGDLVLLKPIETTTIFLSVFLIASVLEFLIDTAAGVRNKYFRVIFNLINQEVMIIGVLVLCLVFTQTVYAWEPLYVYLFKWAIMCLFLMVIFFCGIVLLLIAFTKRLAGTWATFEAERMDSATHLAGSELDYKNGYLKFMQCMQVYGYSARLGVRFSDYLTKMIRRHMVKLSSLSWAVWICLATFVIFNAIRAEITRAVSQMGVENIQTLSQNQKFVNYLSFIVLQGYVVLASFLAFFFLLKGRLTDFLNGTRSVHGQSGGGGPLEQPLNRGGGAASADAGGGITSDTLEDPRIYLFRRSVESTLQLLQIILICLEWYIATFSVSFILPIYDAFPIHTMVILYVVAAGPLLMIPMLPRTLMMISMMSSLGTNLDERAVQYFIRKTKIPEDELPMKMRKSRPMPALDVMSNMSGQN